MNSGNSNIQTHSSTFYQFECCGTRFVLTNDDCGTSQTWNLIVNAENVTVKDDTAQNRKFVLGVEVRTNVLFFFFVR